MIIKSLKIVAAVGGASVLAASLTAVPAQATPNSEIVIALEAPLTGDQSNNGKDQLRGAKLAAAQINAAGGILGHTVKIVGVDDKANPDLASAAVNKAVKAGAGFVVGPYNSSVGIINLPLYVKKGIFPMRMTSSNDTEGFGATTQPMNSQISPAEITYISGTGVKSVVMLVDPSEYTASIANQTQAGLEKNGISVTQIAISESTTDLTAQIAQAMATNPGMIYSSTYYPQGSEIAKELLAQTPATPCFMGLANVDPAFVSEAGLPASQHCVFSGVPAAPQLPTAKDYTKAYVKAYKTQPGVWGAFTYDSVKVLAAAITRAGSTGESAVKKAVLSTRNYKGATGTISYSKNPKVQTGNRLVVPVEILAVDNKGTFVLAD
jgi:ABC-type branched-subunit amino acid transport system substrate-binding protein